MLPPLVDAHLLCPLAHSVYQTVNPTPPLARIAVADAYICSVADLESVVAPVAAGEADLMLGAREAAAGAWPWHAKLANRLLALELRRRCGVHISDLGPMRAASRRGLLSLGLRDRGFGWPLEMVLAAAAREWRIGETPVPYRPRAAGRSKVSGSLRGTLRAVHDMGALLA